MMRKLFSLLLLVILAVSAAQALSCTQHYQCNSVTTDYNYVDCLDGQCQCLSDLNGFSGLATTASKCSCPSGWEVYWKNGQPYCFNLQNAIALQHKADREALIKSKVRTLYTGLIHPSPQYIIFAMINNQSSIASNLFAQVSDGRVDPAGVFHNFSGMVEYFYGAIYSGNPRIVSIDIQSLIADGNHVSIRVNLLFNLYSYTDPTQVQFVYNLTQSGVFRFNSDNLIDGVELIIHNLGKSADFTTPTGADLVNLICGTYIYNTRIPCTADIHAFYGDAGGQYNNFTDCFNTISAEPQGTWDRLASNTQLCRLYHVALAAIDPFHCPHVGKTGGGKCVDTPYAAYYQIGPFV
jgi:hypothetical protein